MTDDAPEPELRARDDIAGTAVALADGRDWLLADGGLLNRLDDIRDRIFDDAARRDRVRMVDVVAAATVLLTTNYRLSGEEAFALVATAPEGEAAAEDYKGRLTRAVMRALFGADAPRGEPTRTYTAWAASQLLANGIDPAAVPGPLRGFVLETLVATGRAVAVDGFCEAPRARAEFDMLRAIARDAAAG